MFMFMYPTNWWNEVELAATPRYLILLKSKSFVKLEKVSNNVNIKILQFTCSDLQQIIVLLKMIIKISKIF